MVVPFYASFFSNYTILKAVCESRPEVGSSKNNILGLDISSYPIEVLFFSPPESPLIRTPPNIVSLHDFRLSLLIKEFTLFSLLKLSPSFYDLILYENSRCY